MSLRLSVLALTATLSLTSLSGIAAAQTSTAQRPFGTLREQAAMQQDWLKQAARHVPARADAQARHRPLGRADARIHRGPGLLGDHRAGDIRGQPPHHLRVLRQVRRRRYAAVARSCVERIALGGTSQGGVFEARRSTKAAAGDVGRGQQAELWGDEQWQIAQGRRSRSASRGSIGINRSTVFAFSDGLSSGELQGHDRRARRAVDVEVQGRRRAAAGAHRRRACPRKKPSSSGCRSWSGR